MVFHFSCVITKFDLYIPVNVAGTKKGFTQLIASCEHGWFTNCRQEVSLTYHITSFSRLFAR